MQINYQRIKKYVSLLCGICLSFSVFYGRGLITFALPASTNVNVKLSNVGMLAQYNGSIESTRFNARYSDLVDVSVFDSLTLNSFNITGTSSFDTFGGVYSHDPFNFQYMCYDENNNYLGYRTINGSVSFSGSSPSYAFVSTIPTTELNLYSGTKYIRFNMRNLQENYSVIYNAINIKLQVSYDDGSFNLAATTVSSLYLFDSQNIITSVFSVDDATIANGDVILEGTYSDDYDINIRISGFEKPAYYDIDITYEITMTPFAYTSLTNYLKSISVNNGAMYYYPRFVDLDLPEGLFYNYEYYNYTSSSRALYYQGVKDQTNYTVTSGEPYVLRLHIYGNTYVNKAFSAVLKLNDTLQFTRFNMLHTMTTIRNAFRWTITNKVSGAVQATSHNSGSEIEALENIDDSINKQTDEMIKEHNEEITEANKTSDEMSSSITSVTKTLTAIEILKLPWTMLQDLYNAIISDGQQSLIFPSFHLMGYTLWESYEFDLSSLDSNFPVLFKSVRLISGFLICFAFGTYIRGYFTRLFGGDVEVD